MAQEENAPVGGGAGGKNASSEKRTGWKKIGGITHFSQNKIPKGIDILESDRGIVIASYDGDKRILLGLSEQELAYLGVVFTKLATEKLGTGGE